jgi:hypothetical protein
LPLLLSINYAPFDAAKVKIQKKLISALDIITAEVDASDSPPSGAA